MTHLGYILAGWGISLGVLGSYTLSVLRRAKAAAQLVPQERQRWIDANTEASQ